MNINLPVTLDLSKLEELSDDDFVKLFDAVNIVAKNKMTQNKHPINTILYRDPNSMVMPCGETSPFR